MLTKVVFPINWVDLIHKIEKHTFRKDSMFSKVCNYKWSFFSHLSHLHGYGDHSEDLEIYTAPKRDWFPKDDENSLFFPSLLL